jgi:hypothetical protein
MLKLFMGLMLKSLELFKKTFFQIFDLKMLAKFLLFAFSLNLHEFSRIFPKTITKLKFSQPKQYEYNNIGWRQGGGACLI